MSKPNGRRYKLETVRASYVDAVGGEQVEFEVGPDAKVFSFLHPMLADDDFQRDFDQADGDRARARLLLGDEYDAFVKAGGDANSLILLYVGVRNEMADTLGKHRPPRTK